jgi:hypothetical protein
MLPRVSFFICVKTKDLTECAPVGCCTNYLGTGVPCPVVLPHQGDGAVHQVTSHSTQVPVVMVRYTGLPHTPTRYQPLWCSTPGYLTPHPGTSRYGAVHQVTSHPTQVLAQVPAVMVWYTVLPHRTTKYMYQ